MVIVPDPPAYAILGVLTFSDMPHLPERPVGLRSVIDEDPQPVLSATRRNIGRNRNFAPAMGVHFHFHTTDTRGRVSQSFATSCNKRSIIGVGLRKFSS